MSAFLLEILSEEIPARMQDKASADLARLFEAEIAKAGLQAGRIERFVTPRRLALIAHDLPAATEAVSEEIKGPRADAPAQALAGFLGKTGLTRDQLVERSDAKGHAVLFAVIDRPGRPTAEVLAEAIPAILRGFAWPKAMRWGAASLSTESPRWVRPLRGLVALLGADVVPFEVAGIVSGRETVGHRFHHPQAVSLAAPDAYAATLRDARVIVDAEERRRIVREGAEAAAREAGLVLVADEGLVAENAGLTEWPVPLLGRFDPAFLAVPREVIQLTMRTNQKYFSCNDADGQLAPAFVCTANIVAADGGAAIVEGNAKVLAARLSDARFFWEQDLRVPLETQAAKLGQIVFHEKLGTVADKVARVAKLARWLVEEGIVGSAAPASASALSAPFVPSEVEGRAAGGALGARASTALGTNGDKARLADMAELAATLAKADLVTGMVGEFPELQGVMGGYYARHQGLDPQVADAIRDHYKPVGQGDDVPTAPVTVAVSLADKLDTISAFFSIDQKPSGSRDPFALRRAAIGVIALIFASELRLPVLAFVEPMMLIAWRDGHAVDEIAKSIDTTLAWRMTDWAQRLMDVHVASMRNSAISGVLNRDEVDDMVHQQVSDATHFADVRAEEVLDFFADRLKVQQREAGVRHDLIDAVFALGGEDDLVRLLARVKALQAFVETEEGANLLAGYRRAANILRAEAKKGAEPQAFTGFDYTPDAAEAALAGMLAQQLPIAEAAIEREDFAAAMTALSVIRPIIDRFFEDVIVNSEEQAKRTTRLALLAHLRAAMHKVADFSRIEG